MRVDQQVKEKVLRECKSNFKFVLKRFKFLKTIPKGQRPIDHEEIVASWEAAIEEYKNVKANTSRKNN